MLDAYIYDGLRSPFGRYGGALADIRPDDLMAQVIAALMARSDLPQGKIEDVVLGNVCQSGEDSRNLARFAGLLAGLPQEAGAQTVNRLCGSGMAAALDVARAVTLGEGELFVAGGVESMTRAPLVMAKAATAWSRKGEIHDATAGKPFPNPRFQAQFGGDSMPQTADNLAAEFGISRDACDRYALASQQRYESARASGFFADEIIPVSITGPKGAVQVVDRDEHPRPDTTLDRMARLPSLATDGVVTAANASGINDGAGALVIGRAGLGSRPRARILAGAVSGVAPRVMGLGPAQAIPKALDRAGLTLSQMDVLEINEAFAAQVLACCDSLGLAHDEPRLNPNGGAIAIGHPLGASGARLILTGLRQLEAIGGRYACLSMCIGFGQGIAMIIERLD
ncbi:acetyl-CoA C-acyltransferase [Paracoccus seriniphilus]|uniref:Acetyl-CoA C-acetyltransferase n=1 Tax=Paracoccus seriniphilus TaxID=184748 RepID=A0A239PSD8_9RHOB|nr:acetyl-CoA C-acyltransferase [Paracoccus seriniphilus]WCR12770.1 acetyl-CoA C-acyltransferase [Paracoccus seriniphilus]SNT72816.1 acetyl-CoA C-acetyltransferase [Paracoccus seriniphilus]